MNDIVEKMKRVEDGHQKIDGGTGMDIFTPAGRVDVKQWQYPGELVKEGKLIDTSYKAPEWAKILETKEASVADRVKSAVKRAIGKTLHKEAPTPQSVSRVNTASRGESR